MPDVSDPVVLRAELHVQTAWLVALDAAVSWRHPVALGALRRAIGLRRALRRSGIDVGPVFGGPE